MVVDFLGLPGAGKSTLACHVAECLAQQGIPVARSPHILSHGSGKIERIVGKAVPLAREVARRPGYACRVARTIMATRQHTGTDLIRTLANWLYVEALLKHGAAGLKVQLVEQGMAQALWSIGFSAGHAAWADMIGRHDVLLTTPHLVVLVEADLSTVHRRLANRPATVRLERTLGQDPATLARSSALLMTVVGLLQEKDIPIVIVRNEQQADLAAGAGTVASRIAALWGDRAVAA